MNTTFKALICISSCHRITEIKKYIFDYIDFCNKNSNYDFLIALDGFEEEYSEFCKKYTIPMLNSENREGVGLSKNRVLLQFPKYDYYFFVEDDMELYRKEVFAENIAFYNSSKVPHLSWIVFGAGLSLVEKNNWQFLQGFYSGAQFSFFEAKALFKVGGWNTLFAKYKRFGHSEHSYRFFNNGFQDYPFIALTSTADSFILHDPPHVTVIENEGLFDHYHPEEKQLIESKTLFFPITTISPYYFNGFDMNFNLVVEEFLRTNKRRYPLTVGKNRRIALAEYYFEMFIRKSNLLQKLFFLLVSFINKPFSTPMKHYLKTKLKIK